MKGQPLLCYSALKALQIYHSLKEDLFLTCRSMLHSKEVEAEELDLNRIIQLFLIWVSLVIILFRKHQI